MLVLCTLNFRQNELNIAYKVSLLITNTNLFLFSIPKTTHFHECDISFLFIYIFYFSMDMWKHVQFIILDLCFKIYANSTVVFVSWKKKLLSVFSLNSLVLNLSMLVSIFEIFPFDSCIITSIFKYHSLIEGYYHWRINILFLL